MYISYNDLSSRAEPAANTLSQCTGHKQYMLWACWFFLGLGILGDIIGVIWLQVLRNRKRKLVVNMYAERVDKRLEHLKWMPKWMRRFIVWRTSRQLANRDERRNDFLRNRDY